MQLRMNIEIYKLYYPLCECSVSNYFLCRPFKIQRNFILRNHFSAANFNEKSKINKVKIALTFKHLKSLNFLDKKLVINLTNNCC